MPGDEVIADDLLQKGPAGPRLRRLALFGRIYAIAEVFAFEAIGEERGAGG